MFGCYPSLQTINAGEGVEKRVCSCTVGGNVNGYSHYGRWYAAAAAAKSLQLCPTLCDLMNRSMPGLSVHHQLLEFTQTPVHRVSDAIQPSNPLSSPPALNPSQHQSLFQ